MYMGDRQNSNRQEEVHKRGILKSNKGLIDKVLERMSLLLFY
jgi:hypothetical protein